MPGFILHSVNLLKVSISDYIVCHYQTRFTLVGQVLAQVLVSWLGCWSLGLDAGPLAWMLVPWLSHHQSTQQSWFHCRLRSLLRFHSPLSKMQLSEELKTKISGQEVGGSLTSTVCPSLLFSYTVDGLNCLIPSSCLSSHLPSFLPFPSSSLSSHLFMQ